jgi:hypothetical protein
MGANPVQTTGKGVMMLRKLACYTVLTLGLSQTIAPAGACEGGACRQPATSTRPSQPLQLGDFMQPTAARPAAEKTHKRATQARQAREAKEAKEATKTKQARRRVVVPLPPAKAQTPLPAEAATAYAAQPAMPVRVVASDELNEIDMAAGPAPAETTGIGPRRDDEVQLVDADELNDIDRKGDVSPMASVMASAAAPAQTEPAGASYLGLFWTMLQNAFAALGTAFRYLFG